MNEYSKKINKEETDIRMVCSELESLLRIFSHIQGGRTPASEETKQNISNIIKDYCDTISQYVDLF